MRASRLFVQLSIYYLILFGGAWLLIHNNPELQSYLPIGGAEAADQFRRRQIERA